MSKQKYLPHEDKARTDATIPGRGDVWTGGGDFIGRDKLLLSGNLIVLNSPPDEVLEMLLQMINMRTELPPGPMVGGGGTSAVLDRVALQHSIDQVLNLFEHASQEGVDARSVEAGQLRISRVELLLKKAILLRAEADEMLREDLDPRPPEASIQHGGPTGFSSKGADQRSSRPKMLKSAYALLKEANEIDPVNTEVLLQMAELQMELSPDDPRAAERILRRVRKLSQTRKDERERFQFAQATYLLATARDLVDHSLLEEARRIFVDLGKSEWRRQCDDLLNGLPVPAITDGEGNLTTPSPSNQPSETFNPLGRWHFQVMDAAGSVLLMEFDATGTFRSSQQSGGLGINRQGSGQWAYNPFSHALELQGLLDGVQPFVLGIFIQGAQQDGYYGLGTDGNGYLLNRI